MRTPVIAVWAAVLLTYGVSTGMPVDPKTVAGPSAGANNIPKLDMAEKSVDDMYNGCKAQMEEKLQKYLENEKNKDPIFKRAWESSEQYQQNLNLNEIEEKHVVAIHCYTSERPQVYPDFNNAVRTQGPDYTTTFGYHALHFLLTDAIQTLRQIRFPNPKGEDGCVTGYRCVDIAFNEVNINTELRFGSFTSSSRDQYLTKKFGDKTCFEIYTCFGVDVSMYSTFENEGEVLIPPYEVFKVVGVKKRGKRDDLPCEVEYKLRSTKEPVSNLNCTLFK